MFRGVCCSLYLREAHNPVVGMCALNDGAKRQKVFFKYLFHEFAWSPFPAAFWMARLNQSVCWYFLFCDQNYQQFATSGSETSAVVALRPCNEPQRRAVMAFVWEFENWKIGCNCCTENMMALFVLCFSGLGRCSTTSGHSVWSVCHICQARWKARSQASNWPKNGSCFDFICKLDRFYNFTVNSRHWRMFWVKKVQLATPISGETRSKAELAERSC